LIGNEIRKEEQTAEGRGRRLRMTSHLPVRKLCQGTFGALPYPVETVCLQCTPPRFEGLIRKLCLSELESPLPGVSATAQVTAQTVERDPLKQSFLITRIRRSRRHTAFKCHSYGYSLVDVLLTTNCWSMNGAAKLNAKNRAAREILTRRNGGPQGGNL